MGPPAKRQRVSRTLRPDDAENQAPSAPEASQAEPASTEKASRPRKSVLSALLESLTSAAAKVAGLPSGPAQGALCRPACRSIDCMQAPELGPIGPPVRTLPVFAALEDVDGPAAAAELVPVEACCSTTLETYLDANPVLYPAGLVLPHGERRPPA